MLSARLTPAIIAAAIEGFEAQKIRIDAQIAELRAFLAGGAAETDATPEPSKQSRRKMSAAARKRMGEAQRKRWAESKKTIEPSVPEVAPKPKRKLSEAGRAAIVAAPQICKVGKKGDAKEEAVARAKGRTGGESGQSASRPGGEESGRVIWLRVTVWPQLSATAMISTDDSHSVSERVCPWPCVCR
jgi:hypothetical protein